MVRGCLRALLATSPTPSLTPPPHPLKINFTLQCVLSSILSPCSFLTVTYVTHPPYGHEHVLPIKVKNLLLHCPKAAFLPTKRTQPTFRLTCTSNCLDQEPIFTKNSEILFEFIPHHLSQAYSEPFQKSKMEHFAKIVNS